MSAKLNAELENLYTTTIDIIEGEFPESAQYLKDRLAAMATSVPCRLVIGDSLAVRQYAPAEPEEVDWEADVIHQYRPGAEYATNLHSTPGQVSFRDVQTPELKDIAIVLAGELSIHGFFRKINLMPFIQWADHLIFANANTRLSEDKIEALNLILALRQHGQGASDESDPLPVIYVQHVVNSDTEAREIFEANLSSLTAAGQVVDESFLIRDSSDESDLDEYLEGNEARIRTSQIQLFLQYLKDTITPVRDQCFERVDLYSHQAQEQLTYETLLNRKVKLNQLLKGGRHTRDPIRALQDSLSQGKRELNIQFQTITSNGGTSLYTEAKPLIDSTRRAVPVRAKYDRARLRANDVLMHGFSAAINRAVKIQNETLLTISATTEEAIKHDLESLGFTGLFMPPASPVDLTLPDPVEIPELDPKTLPSKGDLAFRYGFLSSFGGGSTAALVTSGIIKPGMLVAIPLIGVSAPVVILAGIAIGCVLAFLTLRSQAEKGFATEMESKMQGTLHAMSIQAGYYYDQFSTIWQRALEDGVSKTMRDAEEAVDAELMHAKAVSTKTPDELKALAEKYAAMVRKLEDILTKV